MAFTCNLPDDLRILFRSFTRHETCGGDLKMPEGIQKPPDSPCGSIRTHRTGFWCIVILVDGSPDKFIVQFNCYKRGGRSGIRPFYFLIHGLSPISYVFEACFFACGSHFKERFKLLFVSVTSHSSLACMGKQCRIRICFTFYKQKFIPSSRAN